MSPSDELGLSYFPWCLLVGFALVLILRGSYGRPSETHGSAAFGKPIPKWLRTGQAGELYLGCWRRRAVCLPRTVALRHGLILGPSGSGKSHGFFLPNAVRSVGASCVFTDPKSELWNKTSGLHPSALRYAPCEPKQSAPFNWIPLCQCPRMAELIARAIVLSGSSQRTEQVWIDLETGLLTALFAHAATLLEPTPLAAYHLLVRLNPEELMAQLDGSEAAIAREQANLLRQMSERMRGSIVPVVAARLQFLRDPAVASMTSSSLLGTDLSVLRRKATAVYWCLREQDVVRLRPLSAVFFAVLIEQLISADPLGEGRIPVTLFLDEFAAIGPIPEFETLIAVARGRGIALWLGVQSLAQLELRYGSVAARTILTNCGSKLILPGLDVDSAEYVSRSLGPQTRNSQRRSWQYPFLSWLPRAKTVGDSEHARPLLTADEIRRLPEQRLLAIVLNQLPMLLVRQSFRQPYHALGRECLGVRAHYTGAVATGQVVRSHGEELYF